MNVMALYDIHGNVDALEAVLGEAEPDAVLVGGDAVPGPFAAAVLDRLESLRVPVHWIRGNGEREVAEAVGAPRGRARRPRRGHGCDHRARARARSAHAPSASCR